VTKRPKSIFESALALKKAGFKGFVTVEKLLITGPPPEIESAGVYVVLRTATGNPRFLARSRAGEFRKRSPTLPVQVLRDRWLNRRVVLYIGVASGKSDRSTLRYRIHTYLRFGRGRCAAHWGGRAIWQLADSNSLVLAWMNTDRKSAKLYERNLLRQFVEQMGALPFANRRL
jgi:hypothetical protein